MTEIQTEILIAATYIAQYDSGTKGPTPHDPVLYQIAAAALRSVIRDRKEMEFIRGISESFPAIQGMISDTIWDSRITRNRAQHCPELHEFITRMTAQ